MVERIGIIGVGHLASYLVEGLRKTAPEVSIVLSRHLGTHTERLVAEWGATPAGDNQAVADAASLVLVATRPPDLLPACREVSFRGSHTVISTAVGVPLAEVQDAVWPARAVRAMPLTCSAVNQSPTLVHPDDPWARALFERLGSVLALEREDQFTPASAIAAYYGWIYALLDQAVDWTVRAGVHAGTARKLVLETTRGAAEMGLAYPDQELSQLLDSLATPGGITRQGLDVLAAQGSLGAWREALDVVLDRLRCPEPDS